MTEHALNALLERIAEKEVVQDIGRVVSVENGLIEVRGLEHVARQSEQIRIDAQGGPISGEVLKLSEAGIVVLPECAPDGVSLGDTAFLMGENAIAPCDGWIGRIIDPMGQPLDGASLPRGHTPRPLKCAPISPARRNGLGARLETGMCAFNTVLPLVEGQRMGLFAGSGVGKSSLLGHFARRVQADVVVLALIGERGREVSEFVRDVLGPEGLARTVIIAATSDQSALLRRRCALAAMSVAEHFRDKGKRVLLLADSLTRFAEAHREIAVAAGELPSMRGYPASLSHQLMSLCERAGPGQGNGGVITAIFSVLVAGSDMEEPVADILRGVLDGHTVLDRQIAERGRYPAIDLLRSVSRSLPAAANDDENSIIAEVRYLLSLYDRAQVMIDAGLYEEGKNPELDRAVNAWSELDSFLSLEEPHGIARSFDKLRLILRKSRTGGEVRRPEVGSAH